MKTRGNGTLDGLPLLTLVAGSVVGMAGCSTPTTGRAEARGTHLSGSSGSRPGAATPARVEPGRNPIAEAIAPSHPESKWRPASAPAQASRQSRTGLSEMNLYGELANRPLPGGSEGRADRGAGGNLSRLSFSVEGADFDPDLTPDGTRLVFASTQHSPTPDIYIKAIESRAVTQLTSDPAEDVMPRVSPDGLRVAFASNRSGNWDIYVMPIEGGKPIQVTSTPADELHPSWSPDGRSLVFCGLGAVSGRWELWVTDVNNSGVARYIGDGLFPAWCPAGGTGESGGDRIAYQKSRDRGDRAFSIWTLDYRDGEATNLTEVASSPAAACIGPCWSPDGRWLAYATVPSGAAPEAESSADPTPAGADLWMTDLSGRNRVRLSVGPGLNLQPVWTIGDRLVFVSDRAGTENIWSMDMSGAVRLATGPGAPARSATAPAEPTAEAGADGGVATAEPEDGPGGGR